MPFIAALGYDVFNPLEVLPEYTADVGIKKGEKIDYAIMREGETIMLIECKKASADLSAENMSQLYRYFGVSKARIAILTNGIRYLFFSDLEEKNKMDRRPFLDLDLNNPRENVPAEVKKMAKDDFDLDTMLSAANEMKYVAEIKKVLSALYDEPQEEFVRMCFKQIMPDSLFTTHVKKEFTPLVAKAFHQFLSDKINTRLRSALEKEKDVVEATEAELSKDKEPIPENGIVTTEEELEGFNVVRAIMAKTIDPERVAYRDTKSYFGILLDDNNRKPICRLHFNTSQKYTGLFNQDKKETRTPINAITDIYQHTDRLRETIKLYE